jgi:DNA-binding response OmpR family regulator
MDGFQVTEEVRADSTLDGIKIILLTAKGQECDREVGKTAGANAYMTKPFSPSKILDRAREILGS